MNNAAYTNTNSELDHQFGKPVSVNQDNALRDIFNILTRLIAKGASRHKHALCCPKAYEAPDKSLNRRASNGLVRAISLRLNIDSVKAETIFINYSIDATIA